MKQKVQVGCFLLTFVDSNIKEILKNQVDENKKFREMLSNFIDHKNPKALIEDIPENKNGMNSDNSDSKSQLMITNLLEQQNKIINITSKCDEFEKKCKKYKVYYKIFKHSQCLQCKY